MPADGGVHTICHLERVRISAHRAMLTRDSQHVVRAHRDGVDRYLAIYQCDRGGDINRVEVRAKENCRPGRVRRNRECGLMVAELLFDRRLRAGETHLFGYGFTEPDDAPLCREFVRGFTFLTRQYVLQVIFDPAALPVRCRRFARGSTATKPEPLEDLTLDGRHSVHIVACDIRLGLLGIIWDWE